MGIYGFDGVLVGGLIDASLVAARLRALAGPVQTQVVAYFHENQLTAPTAPGDRDVAKGIHWLHGARNWHTVLAADRVLFNSKTQLDAFLAAPPALFSGQCRDKATRGSHGKLLRAARNKASVLHYGLDLEELRSRDGAPSLAERSGAAAEGAPGEAAPVILWNARLEADKDPEEFLDVLGALAGGEDPRPFRVFSARTPRRIDATAARFARGSETAFSSSAFVPTGRSTGGGCAGPTSCLSRRTTKPLASLSWRRRSAVSSPCCRAGFRTRNCSTPKIFQDVSTGNARVPSPCSGPRLMPL